MTGDVLPNPVFEGSEKRLEVDFTIAADATAGKQGLRALSRAQLDELMTFAHCCIVSSRRNDHFDAYVLSESSLFVYPTKWILKTCGTTRLLNSVPRLLEFAAALGLKPSRCKFSRATFLFPEQQVSSGPRGDRADPRRYCSQRGCSEEGPRRIFGGSAGKVACASL